MDEDKFTDYVRRNLPSLRAYVAKRTRSDDVSDVVQETFRSLWITLQRPDYSTAGPRRLSGLLYRIADRRIADYWRVAYRREEGMETLRSSAVEAVAPSALDEILSGVPPEWLHELSDDELRLLLRVVEGTPIGGIARELGISPNAVSSRIKRLRAKVPKLAAREVAND